MKKASTKIVLLFLLLCGALCMTSCEKEEGGSGSLGGSTDLPENEVGAVWGGALYMGEERLSVKMTVVKNSNGVIELSYSLDALPENMLELIRQVLDNHGGKDYGRCTVTGNNVSGKLKLLNSSEGVAVINDLGGQAVIMKYNANVGDSWTYKTVDGQEMKFTVTKKSTENDFDYIFSRIKVVQVEELSTEPGVSKIVYTGNHKFGLVNVEVFLEDGKTMRLIKYSSEI